jgi:hypothetical protein
MISRRSRLADGVSRDDSTMLPQVGCPFAMVNVSSSPRPRHWRAVGKAGPDLFRSPVMRCSHARFPRCKAMAHALREALKAKAVETAHSDCLELLAKAFGYENGNILSAKIAAAQPRAADERALSPAAAQTIGHCDRRPGCSPPWPLVSRTAQPWHRDSGVSASPPPRACYPLDGPGFPAPRRAQR